MHIHITRSETPVGKLADIELHFDDGPLAGLKLIGFAVWEAKRDGSRNVTFPAKQYTVNAERRTFALLRSSRDSRAGDAFKGLILKAFGEFEVQN